MTSSVFLISGSGISQQQFIDETETRLPEIVDYSLYSSLGDIDRDGDLDILISNSNEGVPWVPYKLLINDGSGVFTDETETRFPLISLSVSWGFLADIEYDGDLDCYIGHAYNYDRLLLNNINGIYSEDTEGRIPYDEDTQTSEIEFGDFDNDLDLDFVLVQYKYTNQPNLVFINDSAGYFNMAPDSWSPQDEENSNAVALGDIDGDLDIDVVIANDTMTSGPNRVWINLGDSHFIDDTENRLPIDNALHNDVKMADVDGDGDLDLYFANSFFSRNRLFINDGMGFYTDVTEERLPFETASSDDAEFVDVDNDVDFDILVSNRSSGGMSSRLYINDGTGLFTDETNGRFPSREEESADISVGDFDNDGDADLLLSIEGIYPNGAQNRLLINESTPDSIPPVIARTLHYPDIADTTNDYIISSTVWDNISVAIGELQTALLYRIDGGSEFIEESMYDCGGFIYRKDIPAQSVGTTIQYYVRAMDKMGNISLDPPNAPDSVYSFTVIGTGIDDEIPNSKLPRSFSLSQNFPNPFNPTTVIQYGIPEGQETNVSLTVYDLHGRLVDRLVDESQAPGIHSVNWDGRDTKGIEVASGVYIYRLQAGDYTSTRKMVLVR